MHSFPKTTDKNNISPPPLTETEQDFCSLPFTKICPFSCRIKRVCLPCDTLFFPASRAVRYNTLHLASKVVCQRDTLWKPRRISPKRLPTQIFRAAAFLQNPNNKQELCTVKSRIAPFIVSSPFLGLRVVPCKPT